jgi:hypothetical protein
MADVVQGQTVKQLQLASIKRTFDMFQGSGLAPIPLDEDRCAPGAAPAPRGPWRAAPGPALGGGLPGCGAQDST